MCFLRSIYVNKSHTEDPDAATTTDRDARVNAAAAEIVEQLRAEVTDRTYVPDSSGRGITELP